MSRVVKGLALLVMAVLLVGAVTGCGQESKEQGADKKKQVELGYVQWDSEIASTNVVKKVLEDLGYEVKITAVDAAAMWLGVTNGDFDGIVAAWLPSTHQDYLNNAKDKVENLGANLEGAKIGLVVPAYVTINSIAELDSVKDKFKGEITGIEPGAGIMKATEDAIEKYELGLKLQSSSSAGMTAALKKAVDKEDWIVVTGWTPHWKFAKWDLKYLEDPQGVYGGEEHIATIVRKGLKEDMPEVYQVLDSFKWEPSDMESVMVEIQNGMQPAEAAAKWVQENQDKVKTWSAK